MEAKAVEALNHPNIVTLHSIENEYFSDGITEELLDAPAQIQAEGMGCSTPSSGNARALSS